MPNNERKTFLPEVKYQKIRNYIVLFRYQFAGKMKDFLHRSINYYVLTHVFMEQELFQFLSVAEGEFHQYASENLVQVLTLSHEKI